MQVIVKYLRQSVWHIVPAAVVFLIVLGVQLSIVGFLATVLILISGGEGDTVDPNIVGESIGVMLVILFNALLPCVILFPIAFILDRLTRHRPVWLKAVLPLPFLLMSAILAMPVLVYFFIGIPEILYTFWLSIVDELVILLIVLVHYGRNKNTVSAQLTEAKS